MGTDTKEVVSNQKASSANKRMGLTLLSIAIAFFVSVILKKIFFG